MAFFNVDIDDKKVIESLSVTDWDAIVEAIANDTLAQIKRAALAEVTGSQEYTSALFLQQQIAELKKERQGLKAEVEKLRADRRKIDNAPN